VRNEAREHQGKLKRAAANRLNLLIGYEFRKDDKSCCWPRTAQKHGVAITFMENRPAPPK
jgi:hypothetical protein